MGILTLAEVIGICFVAVVITGVLGVVGAKAFRLVELAIRRTNRDRRVGHMESDLYSGSRTTREEAVGLFLEANPGIKNVKFSSREEYFHGERFLNLLKAKNFIVQPRTQVCRFNGRKCITVFDLTGPEGKQYMIAFQDVQMNFHDSSERPTFQFVDQTPFESHLDNDGINEYFRQGEDFLIVYDFTLDGDANKDLGKIRQAFEACIVERIYYEEERTQDTVRVFEMNGTTNSGFNFKPITSVVKRLNKAANLLYAPIDLEYQGEVYKIAPDKIVQLSAQALNQPTVQQSKNVYIWGTPGTGKTTFADQILANITEDNMYESGTVIVRINAGAIQELTTVGGQSSFDDAIEHLRDRYQDEEGYFKVIFLIDEAESALRKGEDGVHSAVNTFMLDLLDGNNRKKYNASTMLIFNAPKSTLQPALFRNGRMGLSFELLPIEAAQATQAVEYFKNTLTNQVFNEKQFKKVLDTENVNTAGEVYAGKGFITLADIVHCGFVPQQQNDLILDAILNARAVQSGQFMPKLPEKPKRRTMNIAVGEPAPLIKLPTIPTENNTYKKKKGKKRR